MAYNSGFPVGYQQYFPPQYGGSYARGGNRGGERSYARGRGRNARRDSMGRYSRANDDMIEQLRMMMQEAPDERTRQEFQRFITKVEQM